MIRIVRISQLRNSRGNRIVDEIAKIFFHVAGSIRLLFKDLFVRRSPAARAWPQVKVVSRSARRHATRQLPPLRIHILYRITELYVNKIGAYGRQY